MQITNISEAKASLSKLVERVLNGDEVIIGKAGKPVAKLVPYDLESSPRQLGVGKWHGKIWTGRKRSNRGRTQYRLCQCSYCLGNLN